MEQMLLTQMSKPGVNVWSLGNGEKPWSEMTGLCQVPVVGCWESSPSHLTAAPGSHEDCGCHVGKGAPRNGDDETHSSVPSALGLRGKAQAILNAAAALFPDGFFFVPFLSTVSIMLSSAWKSVAESHVGRVMCVCNGLDLASFHLYLTDGFIFFPVRPSSHNVLQTGTKPSCSTSLMLDPSYIPRRTVGNRVYYPKSMCFHWLPKSLVFAICDWEASCPPEVLYLFSLVFNAFCLRHCCVCFNLSGDRGRSLRKRNTSFSLSCCLALPTLGSPPTLRQLS